MNAPDLVDILLVEDDPNDVELVLRSLQRAGITNPVQVVSDGAAALDFLFAAGPYAHRAGSPRPRVVFLDLKLPRVGGLEVLRRLRADARTQSVPVVVFTSSREAADLAAAYPLGVNSYVVKPVDFGRFAAAVGQIATYWTTLNEVPR
jgi:CheY-like chemotaxis protein